MQGSLNPGDGALGKHSGGIFEIGLLTLLGKYWDWKKRRAVAVAPGVYCIFSFFKSCRFRPLRRARSSGSQNLYERPPGERGPGRTPKTISIGNGKKTVAAAGTGFFPRSQYFQTTSNENKS